MYGRRLSHAYPRCMPRPKRPSPSDRVAGWPEAQSHDPVGEVARQLVLNLRAAIGERSLRSVASDCGVSHSTLTNILAGRHWPDLETIAKLEMGLSAQLWPRDVPGP